MSDSIKQPEANPQAPKPVKFIYEKGDNIRTYPADGVWAVVNAQNNMLLEFFIEHPAMPKQVIYQVDDNGNFTGHSVTNTAHDKEFENHFVVVRGVQARVVLSLEAAKNLHAIIGNFIKLSEGQSLTIPKK